MKNPTTEETQTKSIKEIFTQVVGFLIIVFLIVFGTSYASRIGDKQDLEKIAEEKVKEVIKEKKVLVLPPKCDNNFDEYTALKKRGQSIQLANNHFDHGEKGKFVNPLKETVRISGDDDFACGYIYFRVSKSNKPLDNKFDSIYINPQGFGGHILRNKGILLNNTDTHTEALLPLNAVSFLPNSPYNPEAQNFRIANWVNLLNVNSHLTFDIALSTIDKGGRIEEITIGYKCWNVQTGEESNNCQLSLGE